MSQSQLNTMAESNRITTSSAATGISESQTLMEEAAMLVFNQDLFQNKEEEAVVKNLLSLSNKKSSKKTTKTPKQPAAAGTSNPRGML